MLPGRSAYEAHDASSPLTLEDSPSPSPSPSPLPSLSPPQPPETPSAPASVKFYCWPQQADSSQAPEVPLKGEHPQEEEAPPRLKPTTEALDVDICFVRRLRSTSDVVSPPGTVGLILPDLTAEEVLEWAWNGTNQGTAPPLKRGEFLWDGLTEEGLATAPILRGRWKRIQSVGIVMASPLTSAIQTARGMFSRHALYIDTAFQEATNWPHDIRAHTYFEKGRESTSYIMLKGGDGPECGEVVRREKVKVNDAHWLSEFPVTARDERCKEALTPLTLEAIEARAVRGRYLLYEMAKELGDMHGARNQPGAPKLVCVTHGGMLNFLTGDFNCRFRREDDKSDWEWEAPSALHYGDTVVYQFKPTEDDPYRLVEKPRTQEYTSILEDHYKVLKEIDREYRNPDGSVVDQKAEYMKFNKRVAEDVARVHARDPDLFNYLLGVPGPTIDGEMGDKFNIAEFESWYCEGRAASAV